MSRDYRISTVVTPADSYWLVDLAAANAELGLTSDSGGPQDEQVERMIGQVSAAINSYCNRVFATQSYRDQYRNVCNWLGWGKPLILSRSPIALDDGDAILIATVDGTPVEVVEWEADVNVGLLYRLDSGGAPTSWTGSLVIVDYDAGYDVIPDDVQAAALAWLSGRWGSKGRDLSLRSQQIPGVVTETYMDAASTSGMPSSIRDMLAPYRILSV